MTNVLAILPGFMPSAQINIISPAIDLCATAHIRFRLELEYTVSRGDVDWADVILLCRNTRPAQAWFGYLCQKNKPYIYDIDDNFFELSGTSADAIYHSSPDHIYALTKYVQYASLVRVYSAPLYAKVQEINHRIVKVTPTVDFRHVLPRCNTKDDKVKIVYVTSRAQDELFKIFLPAAQKILEEYGTRVEFHFWGFVPVALRARSNVRSIPMTWDYPVYLRRFSSAGYDIGLAPLLDDIFHRSKTNNKFREYGACQIAGIYSDVDVYSSCVSQRQTGILVSNTTDAWYNAMKLLIDNSDLRQEIQFSAYQFVKEHYSYENFVQDWAVQIESVLNMPALQLNDTLLISKTTTVGGGEPSLIQKLTRKFSQSGGWFSFLFFLAQSIRHRFWAIVLLLKYKAVFWFMAVRR